MADSENSRTLPAITRRKMMYGPAAIVPVATIPADDALALPSPHDQTDPVVLLWSQWQAAHAGYMRSSELRSEAGLRLRQEAQYSEVKVCRSNGRTADALSEKEIDLELREADMSRAYAAAKTELAELSRRGNEADHRIGYSRALEAESAATGRRFALAQLLLGAPARSVAGAAVKLDCCIAINTQIAHSQKGLYPTLRQLIKPDRPEPRLIRTDLVMIGGRADGLFRA